MRIGYGYDSHRFASREVCGAARESCGVARGACGAERESCSVARGACGAERESCGEVKPLVLGGVEFPGEPGLVAHSDGDALIHAIIDALLGAAALGDIGALFPPDDPEWSGADSAKMLEAVVKKVRAAGYSISNVDATVICEKPSMRGAAEMIRERLAGIMSIGKGRISVKGKTNEKMDDTGAGIGLEVHAVCLLDERDGK